MQIARRRVAPVEFGVERGDHVRVATGDAQIVDDGPEVEAGSADEHRMATPLLDPRQRLPRRLLELPHREILPGVDQIEEMVGHRRTGGRVGLGRADVHPAVDAHGVDRDDLAVTPARGQREGDL